MRARGDALSTVYHRCGISARRVRRGVHNHAGSVLAVLRILSVARNLRRSGTGSDLPHVDGHLVQARDAVLGRRVAGNGALTGAALDLCD